MDDEHVRLRVLDSDPPGSELVPARSLGEARWELLRSPLYAMEVASGDVVRVLDSVTGAFEVVQRSGNVCVQLYLGPSHVSDVRATANVADVIKARIEPLGGRVDGMTSGLISSTVPVAVGFPAIERVFGVIARESEGAQWQFANVYDVATGEPLGWWAA